MNPALTTGFSLAGSQVGPVVQYFAQLAHMPAMSDAVAGAIGAAVLGGGHLLWTFINTRFPPNVAPVAIPVATPTTTP